MPIERIVSFLPSATELIFELGFEDKLYGVTHECTYPTSAKLKPRVIESVFDSNKLSSREIDDKITELMSSGQNIFKLNPEELQNADPDLIISQEICQVCSAYTNEVNDAIGFLERKPDVFTINPHDIEGILLTIMDISKKIGAVQKGNDLVETLRMRIKHLKNRNFKHNPSVLAIEWIDPFFTAGHWIPEMIELVGGKNLISKKGEHSRKILLDEIMNIDPELIILMPCGFDIERTMREYKKILQKNSHWNSLRAVKEQKIFVVDSNSFFSKPSLRTITGMEILGKIIQPEIFKELVVPVKSYSKII
jgi:iron complex transport system substrate-binding protein|tara:strand:+ start:1827 stop:2750 length:924 start_codon:yes stop_codon:yes gene_type:complete